MQSWYSSSFNVGNYSIPYYFGLDCLDEIVDHLSRYEADSYHLVTDDTVGARFGDSLVADLSRSAPTHVMSHPAGERMKSLSVVDRFLEKAVAVGATRRSVIIALGGGVPGNVAGVMAGLLFRGVRLVQIPTTILAAVDSVLSLKHAVNGPRGKNHFGLYKAPEAIFVDVRMLQSLPSREVRSGLCEVAKNTMAIRPALIPALTSLLTSGDMLSAPHVLDMIRGGISVKSAVMRCDPFERSTGLVLEYGHTVGHAIELCEMRGRRDEATSHGAAVAVGMLAASRIAAAMGALGDYALQVHAELVTLLEVSDRIPPNIGVAELVDVIRADNKRGYLKLGKDEAAFVLLRELGGVQGSAELPLVPVPLGLVCEILVELGAERSTRQLTT
jgi:3-dehydroquinate synthase/2-deoxy-scyllo-inosose synthase